MSEQSNPRDQLLALTLPAGGVFLNVPGDELHDSPFQYRKTYNDAGLDELAASIRETGGIHQPMLVRRRFPNILREQYEPASGFEIVSGHRRKIAGGRAMLPLFPVLVKDLTNDQVRKIQITENLQREDVHPIEEAEGFQALMEYDAHTADELAAQFGKSRSYVYGRLKLLQACPRIRDACVKGQIGTEVALLIARLRTPKLQEKALQRIEGKFLKLEDGGSKSFRAIRELLVEHFTLDLKKPMFDVGDALLVPEAGACGSCPKRVGNAPEYSDLATDRPGHWPHDKIKGDPDVCTDPDCYEAKKKAHLRNEAAALEAKGKTVIEGNKARAAVGADGQVKGAYIALKDVQADLKKAAKGSQATTVTIQDPRTGKTVQAVKREDVKAAGVKVAEPKSTRHSRGNLEAQRVQREQQEKRNEATAKAETAARLNVLAEIRRSILATERSAFDMSLIAMTAWAGVNHGGKMLLPELWGHKTQPQMEKAIGSMSVADLSLFLLDCALIDDCRVSPYSLNKPQDSLLKAAKFYKVDVAAARGDADPKQTPAPSTAERAQKKAGGKAGKKAAPASTAVADFALETQEASQELSDKAASAGEEQKDEPADAGVERDPNTSDMFEGARA